MARLVVVGAGAAGLFAAGAALAAGHSVTLAEHMPGPGRKLLITGKGRCNLTNHCDEETFLAHIRRNPRFLHSAIRALPPAAVMALFEEKLALPLKTERGRRVFPRSDKAQDVLAALLRYAEGAAMVRGEVTALLAEEGRAAGVALSDGRRLRADAVLVATGGVSYPATGSTGAGYALARQAGHAVVPPRPGLVALVCRGDVCRQMAGLSLCNVKLTLRQDEKPVFAEQGEMLFTHFGVSGPLALSASAYLGDMAKHRYALGIDLKPALDFDTLDARLQRDFAQAANRTAAHSLDALLPQSMRGAVLAAWGAHGDKRVNQITKEERRRLLALLKDFRLEVARRGDLTHAVITCGGVDVRGVDPKTMQSKRMPGLFFAGEVLDVDGCTGGYNLQVAWCTASAAARALG